MSLAWALKNLIATLLLPPANGLLLLCLAGFFRRRRWAFGLAILAGALLIGQSLPPVADLLIASLEKQSSPLADTQTGAGAIVVLGSGLATDAPEYGGDTASERTLVRLRYGATVARRHALPVLVTGGIPLKATRSEAEVMADILKNEFGVDVRWQETASKDTAENAAYSATILKAAGINRVVLVTQAFHMPRSKRLFEQAGLQVIPAPTAFKFKQASWQPIEWLPQAQALHTSYYALHEWLGLAWISLTH